MDFKRIHLGNLWPARALAQNYLIVDKTRYISVIEQDLDADAPVFLRPRRFGKTFFTVLLKNYYDAAAARDFEDNFKGSWIFSHKTPMAGSYCCLSFDFSDVSSKTGEVEASFAHSIMLSIKAFSSTYPEYGMSSDELRRTQGKPPSELMSDFLQNFDSKSGGGVYLYIIIDEYDHFADEVLSRDKEEFKSITSTARSNAGFIKNFYACLKKYYGGFRGKPIARFFITGVSSVSLDSMTSGFNIATDISEWPECGAMVGLTHDELSQAMDQAIDFKALGGGITKDRLMRLMERQFDGYVFSSKGERVFNTSMCLAFLHHVKRTGQIENGLTSDMIDDDVAKLDGMMELADPKSRDEISELVFSRSEIVSSRPEKLNLNQSDRFDFGMMVSMLKYLGFLSFAPGNVPGAGTLKYRCPNEAYYRVFVRYLENRHGFRSGRSVDLTEMSSPKADIQPLLSSIEKAIADLPDAGFSGFNEKTLQMCFDFAARSDEGQRFTPYLEYDTGDHGRADVVLFNSNPSGRNFVFELKYLPKGKCSEASVGAKLGEALSQLLQYSKAPRIKAIPRLDCWAVVFSGAKARAARKL